MLAAIPSTKMSVAVDLRYSFDGEVLQCDPPTLLEILWGTDTLRFELRPDGAGTVLTLIDTFDELDYFRNGGILPYVLRSLATGRA